MYCRPRVLETGGSEGAAGGDTAAGQHERSEKCCPVRRGRDGAEHRDGRADPPGTARRKTRRGNQTHLREVPQHRARQGKSTFTQTHKVYSNAFNASFVFPYIYSLLHYLDLRMLVNVKLDVNS